MTTLALIIIAVIAIAGLTYEDNDNHNNLSI